MSLCETDNRVAPSPLPLRHRALVVDASAETRALVAEILSPLRIDVVEAADAETALAWLEDEGARRAPALVVIARSLPSMAGLDIRQMRRHARMSTTPAILLVAHGEGASRTDLRAPHVALVERPLDADTLVDVVSGFLEETVPNLRARRTSAAGTSGSAKAAG